MYVEDVIRFYDYNTMDECLRLSDYNYSVYSSGLFQYKIVMYEDFLLISKDVTSLGVMLQVSMGEKTSLSEQNSFHEQAWEAVSGISWWMISDPSLNCKFKRLTMKKVESKIPILACDNEPEFLVTHITDEPELTMVMTMWFSNRESAESCFSERGDSLVKYSVREEGEFFLVKHTQLMELDGSNN